MTDQSSETLLPTSDYGSTPVRGPATAGRTRNLHSCGRHVIGSAHATCRCGRCWTGPDRTHCAAEDCHRTFGSVWGFDEHRKTGECVDPATLGMVHSKRDMNVWVRDYPGDDEE